MHFLELKILEENKINSEESATKLLRKILEEIERRKGYIKNRVDQISALGAMAEETKACYDAVDIEGLKKIRDKLSSFL